MYFPEDSSFLEKNLNEARQAIRDDFQKKRTCPRCGNGREFVDRGICKGIMTLDDGTKKMCFLKWE